MTDYTKGHKSLSVIPIQNQTSYLLSSNLNNNPVARGPESSINVCSTLKRYTNRIMLWECLVCPNYICIHTFSNLSSVPEVDFS